MRWVGRGLIALLVLALAAAGILYAISWGLLGRHRGPGEIAGAALPAEVLAARDARQAGSVRALGAPAARQILFGDLHVHTTFSTDAFTASLPLVSGVGAHPPADACDYARYCSALDFWSINDHAENLTPRHWSETVASLRQCDALADARRPDVVPFLGWEWTQVGATPEQHFGHKNVVLRDLDEGRVPARPIGAGQRLRVGGGARWWSPGPAALALLDPGADLQPYFDFARYIADRDAVPECPEDVAEERLPEDCRETAHSPAVLFRKLDRWGGASLVIPHGTTWGYYTPAGASWDEQAGGEHDDPARQRLFEVYSGHGSAEEYREWRALRTGPDGDPVCPRPTDDYLPSCWRAGEILEARCRAAGEPAERCAGIAADARRRYLELGNRGYGIVPGQRFEDWQDAGQCRDCFLPAFNYRPGGSAQYALARDARMGFVAASDGHKARPGTGYKERDRTVNVDALAFVSPAVRERLLGQPRGDPADYRPQALPESDAGFGTFETERMASFLSAGGLTAVHAEGRDRDAIWRALERREVYATSGGRTLLWFDLLNPPADTPGRRADGSVPMGSELVMREAPRFRVRAAGSFEQQPGCPEPAVAALGAERLATLCAGECYRPGERRRRITRIEVVRVRPARSAAEPIASLVDDPWIRHECPPDPAGCVFEFGDPDFPGSGRAAAYYVRALEEPSLAINADGFGCNYDPGGRCTDFEPCYQDHRTAPDDDCLSETEERAWSSPIWLDHVRASLAR